jgi:hypothetical protein
MPPVVIAKKRGYATQSGANGPEVLKIPVTRLAMADAKPVNTSVVTTCVEATQKTVLWQPSGIRSIIASADQAGKN